MAACCAIGAGAGAAGAPRGPVYLCAPRHPWEKGTDENASGLLRDFSQKGRSLDGATDAEANAAHATLNRRPRKRLGWECPQGGLLLAGVALCYRSRPTSRFENIFVKNTI